MINEAAFAASASLRMGEQSKALSEREMESIASMAY